MLEFTRHEGGSAGTIVLLHSLALDRSVWDDVVPHLVYGAVVKTTMDAFDRP